MDVFKAMSVFVRIVDEGSLATAAAASDLSPTMVGNYLQALEKRLGVTLLNRTTRRQHLTEFGKIYYTRCVEILDCVADTEALALQSQAEPRGRLRISAPRAFGVDRLTPALADYAKRYPQIEIDLVISDRLMDLLGDGIEAALRIGPIRDDELIARPLAAIQPMLCAAPSYLAAHGAPREPADLADHECLLYTYTAQLDAGTVNARWLLTDTAGTIDLSVPGRIHINSPAGLRRAALAGMGITLLPEPVIADDIESGALVALLADYAPPGLPLHLIYRRDRRISPKLRSFIDFIVARFGRDSHARRA